MKKKEEFKELYRKTFGREISDEELREILDGKRELVPITLNVARALEELAEMYWELRATGFKL